MTHLPFDDKGNTELVAKDESHSREKSAPKRSIRDAWRYAFSMKKFDDEYNENDMNLIDRVASEIVKRQMAVPALLFLESIKPIAFLGSQALIFIRPFVIAATYGKSSNYERFALLMEKREGVEKFIEAIEKLENRRHEEIRSKKQRAIKK